MKKLPLYLVAIIPLVILASCDFLEKFDHFTAGSTFSESFNVTVDQNDPDFVGSVEFAATDDETIKENIDKISDYKINKLSFIVDSYNGPSNSTGSGQFSFSSLGTQIGSTVSVSNINFGQLAVSGQEVEIPLTDDIIVAVRDAYLGGNPVKIDASGELTNLTEPATFEFTVYMSVEARVELA